MSGLAEHGDRTPDEAAPPEDAPVEEAGTDEEVPAGEAPSVDEAPVDEPAAEAPPAGPPPPLTPSLDEVVSQIHAIPIGSFLLSTVSTLASIAYGKLAANELDEARGAIDAIRALIPVLEGRIEAGLKRDFEQALANLQLAYADASAKTSS